MRKFKVIKQFGRCGVGDIVNEDYIYTHFNNHRGISWTGNIEDFNSILLGKIEEVFEFVPVKPQTFTTLEMIADWKDSEFTKEYQILDSKDHDNWVGANDTYGWLCWKRDFDDRFPMCESNLNDIWIEKVEPKPEYIKFSDWEDGVWYFTEGASSCHMTKDSIVYYSGKELIIEYGDDVKLDKSQISYNQLTGFKWIKFEI
jgi:hypothetical protein